MTPLVHHVGMTSSAASKPLVAPAAPAALGAGNTVHFMHAARLLAREARRRGLVAPGFRSPPRVVGAQRTVRRHAQGAVIAVAIRNRPWGAVVADMIEGVVVATRLAPPVADRLRTELWEAIGLEWPTDLARVA